MRHSLKRTKASLSEWPRHPRGGKGHLRHVPSEADIAWLQPTLAQGLAHCPSMSLLLLQGLAWMPFPSGSPPAPAPSSSYLSRVPPDPKQMPWAALHCRKWLFQDPTPTPAQGASQLTKELPVDNTCYIPSPRYCTLSPIPPCPGGHPHLLLDTAMISGKDSSRSTCSCSSTK